MRFGQQKNGQEDDRDRHVNYAELLRDAEARERAIPDHQKNCWQRCDEATERFFARYEGDLDRFFFPQYFPKPQQNRANTGASPRHQQTCPQRAWGVVTNIYNSLPPISSLKFWTKAPNSPAATQAMDTAAIAPRVR